MAVTPNQLSDPGRHGRRVAAVRQVDRRERPALATLLGEAFRDDALSRWIYADHPARMRWVRADFRLRLAQHAVDRLSYTTADLAGAAIWAAPGHWRGHPSGQLRALAALWRVARNRERIMAVQQQLDRRHPTADHLYLTLLGVDPARRREGLGGALLAPTLEQADADRIPAYVEAGSDDAAAFYATLGFAPVGEVRVPGAPVVHLMWREPR